MMYDIDGLAGDLAGIAFSTDPAFVRRKSRDWYSISPLLRKSLEGKIADVIVTPRTKDETRRVMAAAARRRIPITARGGGTANYGQSVPLRGGVVLDMVELAGVTSLKPGTVRALAGTLVSDIDAAARATGWELRFHPTTKSTATIAGFIAGGTGGPGSCAYGVLRDRGNISAVEMLSMEEEPRVVELRGGDAQLAHHAYGAAGIITEVEMPLAPAWNWVEAVVAFPDYLQAVKFGISIGNADGILKKLLSVHEWPTPGLMRDLGGIVPAGHAMMSTLIADISWRVFAEMTTEAGGVIVTSSPEGKGVYGRPLYEFSFGHALFQVQLSEPRRTAIEGLFHAPDLLAQVERVRAQLGGVGPLRMELRRWAGRLVGSGSPYFVFENEEQMAAIARIMQDEGVIVANPHNSSVRSVGKKELSSADIAFKKRMDPHGLLNPGRFEIDGSSDEDFQSKVALRRPEMATY
jgi:FAD/FMN-containing dehydrogenase